eukprot:3868798-Rhodomonas_salina.2
MLAQSCPANSTGTRVLRKKHCSQSSATQLETKHMKSFNSASMIFKRKCLIKSKGLKGPLCIAKFLWLHDASSGDHDTTVQASTVTARQQHSQRRGVVAFKAHPSPSRSLANFGDVFVPIPVCAYRIQSFLVINLGGQTQLALNL